MNMSTRDQIILSVAIMLMLSLMGTFGGYMAGLQTRQNAAMLAADGVVVEGRITNKVERFGGVLNGPKSTWWVDVTYTPKGGETQTKTIGVDKSAYNRASIGPAPVTYIRSNPSLFYIAGLYDGANHSDADIAVVGGITRYSGAASVALGLVLVALLFTRRGGGAPASRTVALPPGRPTGDDLAETTRSVRKAGKSRLNSNCLSNTRQKLRLLFGKFFLGQNILVAQGRQFFDRRENVAIGCGSRWRRLSRRRLGRGDFSRRRNSR